MLTVCWAVKGGSGTSVVVASLALVLDPPVLLVDLGGDLPAVLGLPEPAGPGVHDWLGAASPAAGPTALAVRVSDGVRLLPAGEWGTDHDPPRWRALADALLTEPGAVVVDAGTGLPPAALRERASRALLVTRPCYLALRRASTADSRPSGVVLVGEPGRAYRTGDVEAVIGAPVVAHVPLDPAVARAVDAGLLMSRLPSVLRHELRGAA